MKLDKYKNTDQINKVNRFQEVPLEGIFCDLLWSDPMADEIANAKGDDLIEARAVCHGLILLIQALSVNSSTKRVVLIHHWEYISL